MTIKLAQYATQRFLQLALLTLVLPTVGYAQVIDNAIQPALQDIQRTTETVRDEVQSRVQQRVQDQVPESAQRLTQGINTIAVTVLPDVTERLAVLGANQQELFAEVTLANGNRVLEREWLIVASAEAEQALQQIDAQVLAKQTLGALDVTVLRFKVPAELNDEALLRSKFSKAAAASLVRHFVYDAQSSDAGASRVDVAQQQWCEAPLTIGMIDTAIDTSHPAFAQQAIVQKSFLQADVAQPTAHGTAVAGLLIGAHDDYVSLVPNAKLYSAAIFHRHNVMQQGAALLPLLEAMNWLAEQHVKVINLSLTGPANALLEQAVKRVSERNILLVAAVGNNGPAAPANYPAAYDDVVAVTAADAQGQIYRWANQGDYVEFTARGVQVNTARRDGNVGYETGTSMAAPVVAAAAACLWFEQSTVTATEVRDLLQQRVVDLGGQGRDSVFGFGLLAPKLSM